MQQVLRYLRDHETEFVGQLCDYIRFPSVSAQPAHAPDMKACAEWLLAQHHALGLEAKLHPTAGNPILVSRTPRRPGRKHSNRKRRYRRMAQVRRFDGGFRS